MEENKENAYLTCICAMDCYSNRRRSALYKKALETNNPEDWGKVPMVTALVDCSNMDCFMRKDYKRAMENLKKQKINKYKH